MKKIIAAFAMVVAFSFAACTGNGTAEGEANDSIAADTIEVVDSIIVDSAVVDSVL